MTNSQPNMDFVEGERREELMRLATRGKMASEAEVQEMLRFPDPEPLAALLAERKRWKKHYHWLPAEALVRGARDLKSQSEEARKTGEKSFPWSPLLDALLRNSRLQMRDVLAHSLRWEEEMKEWLERADEKEILSQLSVKEEQVLARVLKGARNVGDAVVAAVMESRTEFITFLTQNQNLKGHHLREIEGWGAKTLRQGAELMDEDPKEARKFLGRVPSAMYSLEHRKDWNMSREFTRSVLEHLHRVHPLGEEGTDEQRYLRSILISLLSLAPQHIGAEHAEVCADLFAGNSWVIGGVAARTDVDIELLRAIARQPRQVKAREKLAKNPVAVVDTEILAILSGSSNIKVASEVLRQAEGAEFRRSFRKVAGKNPSAAMGALEERIDTVGGEIEPTDLLPVLKHENAEARERALRNVHKVGSRGSKGRGGR